MTRQPRSGLTIIEVLIAVAILGVGIVALANLQASSLQYTSRAEQIRTVTQVAEAELEWLRQTEIVLNRTVCVSFVPDGYTCLVGITELGSIGYRIEVTVQGRQADLTLAAFTTGQQYVSGVMPTVPEAEEPDPDVPVVAEPEPELPPIVNPGKGGGKGRGGD